MSMIGHNWFAVLKAKILQRAFKTAIEDRAPGHYLKIQQRFAPMPKGHKQRLEIISRWDEEGMGRAVRSLNSIMIEDSGPEAAVYVDHGAFGDLSTEKGPVQ